MKTKTTREDTFASNSVDITELNKKREFHAGPTQNENMVKSPLPRHMIGVGYEHKNLALTHKGSNRIIQGVFVPTARHPILTMD